MQSHRTFLSRRAGPYCTQLRGDVSCLAARKHHVASWAAGRQNGRPPEFRRKQAGGGDSRASSKGMPGTRSATLITLVHHQVPEPQITPVPGHTQVDATRVCPWDRARRSRQIASR